MQPWSLNEAPPKTAVSLRLATQEKEEDEEEEQEERLLEVVAERLRQRPALYRRLQTAVLGTLDDGTMSWGRVWDIQLQAQTPGCSLGHLGLQPRAPTVAASRTYGCSLAHLRLQPHAPTVAASRTQLSRLGVQRWRALAAGGATAQRAA